MNLTLAYLGRSSLSSTAGGQLLSLAPNLAREPVAFDAPLRHPLRFREAISALHDIVISDLRFKPRDKSAYEEWKKNERHRVAALRTSAYQQAKQEILSRREEPVPPGLEREFNRCRKLYWAARLKYSNYLRQNDPELWRLVMPCDPVITVADDVVFFECFSADESSYGCLTVTREAASANPLTHASAPPTWTIRGTCFTTFKRCVRIVRRASVWTPRVSPSPHKARPTTAKRRLICRPAGCAALCRLRLRWGYPRGACH